MPASCRRGPTAWDARSGQFKELAKCFFDGGHGGVRDKSRVIPQRRAVEDLHHRVDFDKCSRERILRAKANRELVWMRRIASDDECPDRQLIDVVVLVVADDEYPVPTPST